MVGERYLAGDVLLICTYIHPEEGHSLVGERYLGDVLLICTYIHTLRVPSLVPRPLHAQILSRSHREKSIFLHGCEIKSGRRPGDEANEYHVIYQSCSLQYLTGSNMKYGWGRPGRSGDVRCHQVDTRRAVTNEES